MNEARKYAAYGRGMATAGSVLADTIRRGVQPVAHAAAAPARPSIFSRVRAGLGNAADAVSDTRAPRVSIHKRDVWNTPISQIGANTLKNHPGKIMLGTTALGMASNNVVDSIGSAGNTIANYRAGVGAPMFKTAALDAFLAGKGEREHFDADTEKVAFPLMDKLRTAFGKLTDLSSYGAQYAARDASGVATQSTLDALKADALKHTLTHGEKILTDTVSGLGQGFSKGLGQGVALGGATLLAAGGLAGASALHKMLSTDPARKAVFDRLIKEDHILADTIAQNPNGRQMIAEAYMTMCKFAPNTSLDINAARSFLREAALGGSGVNYASIKSLVDTEAAVVKNKGGWLDVPHG